MKSIGKLLATAAVALTATADAKIAAAAEKAHATAGVQDALAQRGITPYFDGPEKFRSFASGFAQEAQGLLSELGLVK